MDNKIAMDYYQQSAESVRSFTKFLYAGCHTFAAVKITVEIDGETREVFLAQPEKWPIHKILDDLCQGFAGYAMMLETWRDEIRGWEEAANLLNVGMGTPGGEGVAQIAPEGA